MVWDRLLANGYKPTTREMWDTCAAFGMAGV